MQQLDAGGLQGGSFSSPQGHQGGQLAPLGRGAAQPTLASPAAGLATGPLVAGHKMAAARLIPAHSQQPGQSAGLQARAQGSQGGMHRQAIPQLYGLRWVHRQLAAQLLIERIAEGPDAIEPVVAALQLQQHQYPLGSTRCGSGAQRLCQI